LSVGLKGNGKIQIIRSTILSWLWWVLYTYFFSKISWCKVFLSLLLKLYRKLAFCIPNIETLRALDYRVLKIYVYTCYCSLFWTFSYCHVLDVLYSILYRAKYYYSHMMLLFPLGSNQMLFFYIFFYYHRIHNGFAGQWNKIFDTDHNIIYIYLFIRYLLIKHNLMTSRNKPCKYQ